jgi:hypothetical protein
VVLCLLTSIFATGYYFYGFSCSRTRFSYNEKIAISGLGLISIFCIWNILTWDQEIFNFNAEQNAPSIRGFIKSAQLPDPKMDTLLEAKEVTSLDVV